jgi:hypothetical protein
MCTTLCAKGHVPADPICAAMRIFESLVLLLVVALWTASALAPLGRILDGAVTADSIDKLVEVTGANDREAATPAAETSKPTDLQPAAKPPIAHTYRNAYGTSFQCSSTWTLLLGMYAVIVVGGLLLLSVIPVRFATTEKMEAPFVLWFGSAMKKPKEKHVEGEKGDGEQHLEEAVEVESLWRRASSWFVQTTNRLFVTSPSHNVDMRYRFHADMTQQLAASAATAKTYESIAVATDDLEVAAPPSPQTFEHVAVSTDDLEVKAAPPPQTDEHVADGEALRPPPVQRTPSRSSVFISAPPSPPVARRRQGSTRLASDSSVAYAESIGRRTSRASSGGSNVETKEDFVRAASRRQSMAARAERRVAQVQEDISYENLGDEEIRMYEYLEFVRELLDGLSIKKVCQKSGRVVSRTFYITPDMATVFWNPSATFKRMTAKSSLAVAAIEQVLKGLHGSANVTARSSPERDALCVSIRRSGDKWLVLEAKTEAMRQRLYLGFSRLAQERQDQDATAAAEQVEATIPEVREEEAKEEEGEEQKQQVQAQARSTMQTLFARSPATSDDHLHPPTSEDRDRELMGEQLEYEEKAPPPVLEDTLPEPEQLLSYEDTAQEKQSESEAQQHQADEGLHLELEEKLDQPFQEAQDEEKQPDSPNVHEAEAPASDEDIDNLSDPEMGRENGDHADLTHV